MSEGGKREKRAKAFIQEVRWKKPEGRRRLPLTYYFLQWAARERGKWFSFFSSRTFLSPFRHAIPCLMKDPIRVIALSRTTRAIYWYCFSSRRGGINKTWESWTWAWDWDVFWKRRNCDLESLWNYFHLFFSVVWKYEREYFFQYAALSLIKFSFWSTRSIWIPTFSFLEQSVPSVPRISTEECILNVLRLLKGVRVYWRVIRFPLWKWKKSV